MQNFAFRAVNCIQIVVQYIKKPIRLMRNKVVVVYIEKPINL